MSYIHDLSRELEQLLRGLEEKRQKEIMHFMIERILESYRNGIHDCQACQGKDKEAERKTRRF